MGSDNFKKIHKWKNWDKITNIAKLVIFTRENYSINRKRSIVAKTLKKKDLIYVKMKKINISSSLIRKFW